MKQMSEKEESDLLKIAKVQKSAKIYGLVKCKGIEAAYILVKNSEGEKNISALTKDGVLFTVDIDDENVESIIWGKFICWIEDPSQEGKLWNVKQFEDEKK